MNNIVQKAAQALNLLKSISEDAPIKMVEHQLARQSVEVIQYALRELNDHSNKGKNEAENSGADRSIFTNMGEEEIGVVFHSGSYAIPHSGYDRCCLNKKQEQSIEPGENWVDIEWDHNEYDNNQMHSIEFEKGRITIKKKGAYIFIYRINMDTVNSFRLIKNGAEKIPNSGINGITKNVPVITPFITLNPGDFITLQARHYDHKPKNIIHNDSFLACERRY